MTNPRPPPAPADTHNAEIFAATTLLVVIGTSLLTQIAGLSLALGAFLVRAAHAALGCAGLVAFGLGSPVRLCWGCFEQG